MKGFTIDSAPEVEAPPVRLYLKEKDNEILLVAEDQGHTVIVLSIEDNEEGGAKLYRSSGSRVRGFAFDINGRIKLHSYDPAS